MLPSQKRVGRTGQGSSCSRSIHVQQPGYRRRTGCSERLKQRVCTWAGQDASLERSRVQLPEWAGDPDAWLRAVVDTPGEDHWQGSRSRITCLVQWFLKSLSFSVRGRARGVWGCRWAVSYRTSTRASLKGWGSEQSAAGTESGGRSERWEGGRLKCVPWPNVGKLWGVLGWQWHNLLFSRSAVSSSLQPRGL